MIGWIVMSWNEKWNYFRRNIVEQADETHLAHVAPRHNTKQSQRFWHYLRAYANKRTKIITDWSLQLHSENELVTADQKKPSSTRVVWSWAPQWHYRNRCQTPMIIAFKKSIRGWRSIYGRKWRLGAISRRWTTTYYANRLDRTKQNNSAKRSRQKLPRKKP